ncbi:hypothetical protein [Spirosoma agri]|uniref:Uncharacterized protein n=1 Tax=Spirosoma agri TaxID=1987381 RepID=A0A6M0IKN4_9BACT|nr:hypothetical protein [Spirosoma agri]NEU67931.1 hypothetical protein [Spirosoma agri]
MKHLPIVLPPHKLESILDGRATQLRVPLDPQPAKHLTDFYPPSQYRKGFEFYVYHPPFEQSTSKEAVRKYPEVHCPYGKRGDLLYVQEEWSTIGATSQDLILKATTMPGIFSDQHKNKPWQPPNTMPKKVARLWLKVTDVGIERAQSIDKPGALCEGPTPLPACNIAGFAPAYVNHYADGNFFCLGSTVAFKQWFMAVYGREFYDRNPWVWVVTFTRTDSPLKL